MVTSWETIMSSIEDVVTDDDGYWVGLYIPVANDNNLMAIK